MCFLDLESIPNFAVYLHTICHSSNFPLLSSPTIIKTMDNRRKVRLHSVRDIISHTPPADDAVKFRITSKRRRALRVGTHRRRWDNTTGHKRLKDAVLQEPAVCDTWKQWPVNSRTDSEKVHRQRNKWRIKSKNYPARVSRIIPI